MNLSEWLDKHPWLKWMSFFSPAYAAAYIVSKDKTKEGKINDKEEVKKKPIYWILVGIFTAIISAALYFVIQKIKSFSK